MLCNKIPFAIVMVALTASACAETPHRFECPATLTDGQQSHALNNASLFDGPPEQLADLVPVSGKTADKWNLTGVDPYLVCRYQGTDKVTTFHAKGAKDCEATTNPFKAYCD
jgi:hypothetical protein